jgi:hypothetical protein
VITESRSHAPLAAPSDTPATDSEPVAPTSTEPLAAQTQRDEHPSLATAVALEPTTEAMQKQIFELVKARVLESIGAGSNWTVTFRTSADTDAFFSNTMADMIAWDVATRMMPPTVPNRARFTD